MALVFIGLTATLAITHTTDPFTTIVTSLAKKLSALPATKWLGDFIAAHIKQTVGAIALGVSVLTSARPKEKTVYFMGAVAFAYLVPEWSVWTYGALAALLALFLQLRSVEDRIILSIAATVIYVLTIQATGKGG